jgi:hypothetical protein
MGHFLPRGFVAVVAAVPLIVLQNSKMSGREISQFARRNEFSAIQCLVTSLQRQLVGNHAVHVPPYIVLERTHQRP